MEYPLRISFMKQNRSEYYQKNKETILAKVKAYRDGNKDKIAAQRRAYYLKNRERIKLAVALHKKENPRKIQESRDRGREKHRARCREWRLSNPERVKAHLMKRYALTRGAPDAELILREDVFRRDNGKCRYCGKAAPEMGWHLDHIVPVSRGGKHVLKNVCVSCPPCNISKHNKLEGEFLMASTGEHLEAAQVS